MRYCSPQVFNTKKGTFGCERHKMRIGKLFFVSGSLLNSGAAAAALHGSQEDLETGKNWEHKLQKRDDVTGHPYTTSYWTSTISGQPTVLSSVGTSYSTLEVTSSFSSEGGGAITIGPGFFDSLLGSSTQPPSSSPSTLSSSSVTDTNGHTASQEPPKSSGTPGEQTSVSSTSASASTRGPSFQSSLTEPARPSQGKAESSQIGQPSSVSSSNTDSRFETVSSNNKGSAISTSSSTQSVKASQPASTSSTTGTDLSYTPSSALSAALPSGPQLSTSRGGSSLESLHTASRSLEMGSTMATGGPTSGVSTKLKTFETASVSSEITSKSVKRSRSDTLSSRNPPSSEIWNTASRTVLSETSGSSSGPNQSYSSSSAAPSSHSLHVSRSETTARSSKAERSSLSVQRPTNERSSSTIFTVSVDRTRASSASSGPVAMSTVSSAASQPGSGISSTSPAVASPSSKADTNSKPSSLARQSRTYGSSPMPLPSLSSGKPSAVNLLSSSTTVFKSNSETVPSAGVSKSGSLQSNVASHQVSDRTKSASTVLSRSNSLYSTGGASTGLTSRTASSTGTRMPLTKQNVSTPVWTTGKVKASSQTVKRSSQQGTASSEITGPTSRRPGNSNASGNSSQRLSAASSVVDSRASSRHTMSSAPTSASMLVNSHSQEGSLSSKTSRRQSYPSISSAKLLSLASSSTKAKPVGPASTTLMPAKSSALLTYVNSSLSRVSSATVDNSVSLISRKPSASQLSLASETSRANMSSTRVESKVSRTEAAYSSSVSGTEAMTPSTATESAHSGPASYKTGSSDTNVGSRSTWLVSPSSRPSFTSTARPHNSGVSEIYTSATSAPSNSVVSWQSSSSFTTNSFASYSELSSVASSSGFVVVDTRSHSSAVSATRSGEQPSVGPSIGSSSTALHTGQASSGGSSEGSAMTGRSGGSTFTSLPVNSVLRTHSISERSVIPTSEASRSEVIESVSDSKPGLSTTVTAVITIPTTVSASGSEHTTSILVTKTVVTACPSMTPRPGGSGVSSEVTQSATSTNPRARDSSSDTSFPQHSRESELPSGSHTNPRDFTGSERPVPSTMTSLQPKATQATSGTDLVPTTLTIATTATITSSGNIRTPVTEMTTTFVATTMYSDDSTAALSSGEPDITSSTSPAAIESVLPTQQSLTTVETTVAVPRTIVSGGQAVTVTESSVKTVTTLCSSTSKTSTTLSHPKEATITAAPTASPPGDTTSSPYNPGDEQTSISSIGEENPSRVPTSIASSPTLKNTLSTQTASVSSFLVSTGLTTADSGTPSIASESSSEAAGSSAAYSSSSAASSRVASTSAESASTVASTGLVQGTSTVNSAPAMTSRAFFSASAPAANSAPRFGSSLAILVLPLILTMSF